ncbi:MAG: translation initiation factor IF-2 [Gemmatimonadales bacterium]|nr:MAG: translation initiation factor IF-2 [Gemmatimonadales bacterium]
MRVAELAQDLKVSTEAVLSLLRAMGIPVPDAGARVRDADVARVLARVEKERRSGGKDAAEAVQAAIEESRTPTRRRRRRRSAEPEPEESAPVIAESEGEVDEGPAAPAAEPAPVPESQVAPEPSEVEAVASPQVTDVDPSSEEERPPEPSEAGEAEEAVADGSADPAGEPEPAEVVVEAKPDPEVPEADAAPDPSPESPEAKPAAPAKPAGEATTSDTPRRRLRVPSTAEMADRGGRRSTKPASVRPAASARPSASARPAASARPTAPARPAGAQSAETVKPVPAASAGPGGQVRVQADGYTPDGRKKGRKKGKKKGRVDQDAVQDNIQRVMAELKGGGSSKKRRRKTSSRPSREEKEALQEEVRQRQEEEAKTVRVNEFLTVSELSELVDVPSTELVGAAFKNLGMMVTINQRLDFDQIELLLDEFNFKAVREEEYTGGDDALDEAEEEEDPELLEWRPPVVTIMGHVDHGKTKLLDSIRNTNVVAGESGGITQHIGAYHVELDDRRSLSFLDTPGHAAFTAMRARGADVTDIVVLVVAADDSIMPQTIEAISHAKNAGVPIVVAINKIDLPGANPGRVKQELLQHEVTVEDFGGDVLVTEISAKFGRGIEDLLEKVLLQAELLELTANPNREAQGTVIESKLDVGKGAVVTVLVQKGTLRVGDAFICGKFDGRVRALLDERGNSVKEVLPGRPVQILGAGGIPQAGDTLQVMDADRAAEIAQTRQRLEREKQMRIKDRGMKLGDFAAFLAEGEVSSLPIIVKADVDGSVQAVADALEQLSTSEVRVEIVHRGVGAINESDVLLAETAGAVIIGFRIRPDTNARQMAEQSGVDIRTYQVIYEAVDEVRQALEGMLAPEQRETVMGTAEVREVFKISRVGTIAGCYVTEGVIDRGWTVRLIRDGQVVYTGKVESLKRFKDDVKQVREGFECGIGVENFNDLKVGDRIEFFQVEEIARTLAGSASSTSGE